MIAILKYVFLGLLLYIFIIPILEQLAVLICQWLENLKGHLLYKSAVLQKKIDDLSENDNTKTDGYTQAIGFTIPYDNEYVEEENDEEI